MKRVIYKIMRVAGCIAIVQAIALAGMVANCAAQTQAQASPQIQVCFVPGPHDCALVVANTIDQARRTLDIQAYNFTEPRIAAAIVNAAKRGVTVRLIVDKTAPSEKDEMTDTVAKAQVPVWIDYQPHIAHNKVMVIDDETVIGGSFNYSTNADEHNAENVTIIHDQTTAAAFEANFDSRLAVSRSYTAP